MRIADFIPMTKTHGPGVRCVVQVQGCKMGCPGCIAPHTWDYEGGREVTPAMVAAAILKLPVEGVTFSGGEPFDQAGELAQVAAMVRDARPAMTFISFTGYRIGMLRGSFRQGVRDLLRELDVVIDGRYVAALDDGVGLRGSSNQTITHLTERCKGFDFEGCKRLVEWHRQGGQMLVVGIPDRAQNEVEEEVFGKPTPAPP